MLLAEITAALPNPNSATSLGWLILTISGGCVALNSILGALEKIRAMREPLPPNMASEEKMKALIAAEGRNLELRIEKRISESLGAINANVEGLKSSMSHVIADFNYALGKIDGRNEPN